MSESPVLNAGRTIQQLLRQSRYRLDVHECPHFLDVLHFNASESLSQPWYYNVTVTCSTADINCAALLLKPASFTFQLPVFTGAPAVPIRRVFGVIASFRQISTSRDETRYALRLVPRIALMEHTENCEVYLNQSVTEVVEQLLRKHGLEGPDFEFRLCREYPPRELITQWRETDLAFIRRLLAEVGIFWRFEMDTRLEQEVLIFQDSQEQYEWGITLPLRSPSGMNDNSRESVWDIATGYNVVTGSVATRDYNYREALTPQDSTESMICQEGTTTGEIYHYAEPFLTGGEAESTESGAFFARTRHERILNGQYTVRGRTNSVSLAPGQVLETEGGQAEVLKEGTVITAVHSSGSRKSGFRAEFEGIPYSETVCFRPSLLKRPVISGSLPARVESAREGDIYAWLDESGRYRVRLDFDRKERERGYAYLWLRMAKPYAGDNSGWHAPLTDGTEVSVMFDGGDPDRPYIASAQHDSEHVDLVTRANFTQNLWRTPARNEWRMEDLRQQEHIRISTEYGKTQLGLGHLVDEGSRQRGSGFELRTDEYGAVRAGRGLFLTADEQGGGEGEVLEMSAAIRQTERANREMEALNAAAAEAGALGSDIGTQLSLVRDHLTGLRGRVLLGSAAGGVALTSGAHMQLTSMKNTMMNAGGNVEMGARNNVSVLAGKGVGVFVEKEGARVTAGEGDVAIEAQNSSMGLFAGGRVRITSAEDEIVISTPQTLTLNGGGSYLKLDRNGIEHGTEGIMMMKVASYLVTGTGASRKSVTEIFNKTGQERVLRQRPGKLSR